MVGISATVFWERLVSESREGTGQIHLLWADTETFNTNVMFLALDLSFPPVFRSQFSE